MTKPGGMGDNIVEWKDSLMLEEIVFIKPSGRLSRRSCFGSNL